MVRLVKRYGSRKLYDTEESRYVSLQELASWIRAGQQLRIIDQKSSEDVTSQTLARVIAEEGRHQSGFPSSEILHSVIRRGEAWVSGISQGVDRLLQAGADRVRPLRDVREETRLLRRRLEELEASLERLKEPEAREPVAEAEEAAEAEVAEATTSARPGEQS